MRISDILNVVRAAAARFPGLRRGGAMSSDDEARSAVSVSIEKAKKVHGDGAEEKLISVGKWQFYIVIFTKHGGRVDLQLLQRKEHRHVACFAFARQ